MIKSFYWVFIGVFLVGCDAPDPNAPKPRSVWQIKMDNARKMTKEIAHEQNEKRLEQCLEEIKKPNKKKEAACRKASEEEAERQRKMQED